MTYTTDSGYVVEPVRGTYRAVAGGYIVDVRCNDKRTTVHYWTANAGHVRDEKGRPYREVRGRPVTA